MAGRRGLAAVPCAALSIKGSGAQGGVNDVWGLGAGRGSRAKPSHGSLCGFRQALIDRESAWTHALQLPDHVFSDHRAGAGCLQALHVC